MPTPCTATCRTVRMTEPVPAGPASRDARALHECVEVSRELGADPFLVLYGGGNSSGTQDGVVYVKASGHDMGAIGPDGFAPLPRDGVVSLLDVESMSDGELVARLRDLLLDPAASSPSIETPLHALLPHESVLHSHADAIVTLTNTVDAEQVVRDALGPHVLLVPYCMPGFELAQWIRRALPTLDLDALDGIVLQHHGLVVFGDSAREAKQQHDDIVGRASEWIRSRTSVEFTKDDAERPVSVESSPALRALINELEGVFGGASGGALVVDAITSPQIERFLTRPDLPRITQQGPTTLEHVIRTKRVPMLGAATADFARAYEHYFARHSARSDETLTMLEALPRVSLLEGVGLVGIGRTPAEALAARTIYRHTIRIIEAAEALGGYRSISEADAFDIEYWELEQAKLR